MDRGQVLQMVMDAGAMHGYPHFKIYKGSVEKASGNPLFASKMENESWEEAKAQLSTALGLLTLPGKYLVQFNNKTGAAANNGNMNFPFEIPDVSPFYQQSNQPAIGNMAGPAVGYVGKDYHESELKREREKHEHDKRIWELDAKLEKLKEKKNGLEKLLENETIVTAVIGFAQQLMTGGQMAPARIGIATGTGTVPPFVPQQKEQEQEEETQYTTEQVESMKHKMEFVMNTLTERKGGQEQAVELLFGLALYIADPANATMLPILETQVTNQLNAYYTKQAAAQPTE